MVVEVTGIGLHLHGMVVEVRGMGSHMRGMGLHVRGMVVTHAWDADDDDDDEQQMCRGVKQPFNRGGVGVRSAFCCAAP